jgi:hypothetical protein
MTDEAMDGVVLGTNIILTAALVFIGLMFLFFGFRLYNSMLYSYESIFADTPQTAYHEVSLDEVIYTIGQHGGRVRIELAGEYVFPVPNDADFESGWESKLEARLTNLDAVTKDNVLSQGFYSSKLLHVAFEDLPDRYLCGVTVEYGEAVLIEFTKLEV